MKKSGDLTVWVVILVIIAFSLLSGDFAETTTDFFLNHSLTILLVALGMLYWWYKTDRRRDGR